MKSAIKIPNVYNLDFMIININNELFIYFFFSLNIKDIGVADGRNINYFLKYIDFN